MNLKLFNLLKSKESVLFSRSALSAWIGFFISIGITFFLWFNARENALEDARIRFKTSTAEASAEIKNRMVAYENVLQGGAALLTTVERMNRNKWHVYIKSANVAKNYPGFQGIGFAKVIRATDLSEHIKKMRLDGFADYHVTSVGKREEYYPIIYLEPLDMRNRHAIGYDMFSNSVRQQAMVRARDTAQAALSAKVTLIQERETDKQAGFLMYIPFYHMENVPISQAQRRERLEGFVFAPFRINDLMNEILRHKNSEIALRVYDGPADNEKNLLYAQSKMESKPLFETTIPIVMYGRTWTAVFQTPLSFEKSIDYGESHLILLGGVPISLLLFLSILSFSQMVERARRMARRMTAEIRALNSELETIIDGAPNPIILHTEDGMIVKMNKAWVASCGYTLEETPTTDIWVDKSYRENHENVKAHIRHLFTITEKIDEGEFSFFSKSGAKITWQFSSAPFGLFNGRRAVISSAMDVTELKKKDDLMMMQSRHAAMGEMISMIAHQWRQPLASIAAVSGILSLDAMMDLYAKEHFIEKLDLISDLAVDLSATIDDFRNFFKEDKIQELLTWKEIVEGSLVVIEPMLKSKNIALHSSYNDMRPFWIYPREMKQVILNLLKNAEDALIDNAISEPQIWIRIFANEKMTFLEIEDNGGGIPEEIINKIFDPYFSTKMDKNGTGIGLYMSKTIVEQHGNGSLSVKNTPQGACFQIAFPLSEENVTYQI